MVLIDEVWDQTKERPALAFRLQTLFGRPGRRSLRKHSSRPFPLADINVTYLASESHARVNIHNMKRWSEPIGSMKLHDEYRTQGVIEECNPPWDLGPMSPTIFARMSNDQVLPKTHTYPIWGFKRLTQPIGLSAK